MTDEVTPPAWVPEALREVLPGGSGWEDDRRINHYELIERTVSLFASGRRGAISLPAEGGMKRGAEIIQLDLSGMGADGAEDDRHPFQGPAMVTIYDRPRAFEEQVRRIVLELEPVSALDPGESVSRLYGEHFDVRPDNTYVVPILDKDRFYRELNERYWEVLPDRRTLEARESVEPDDVDAARWSPEPGTREPDPGGLDFG